MEHRATDQRGAPLARTTSSQTAPLLALSRSSVSRSLAASPSSASARLCWVVNQASHQQFVWRSAWSSWFSLRWYAQHRRQTLDLPRRAPVKLKMMVSYARFLVVVVFQLLTWQFPRTPPPRPCHRREKGREGKGGEKRCSTSGLITSAALPLPKIPWGRGYAGPPRTLPTYLRPEQLDS